MEWIEKVCWWSGLRGWVEGVCIYHQSPGLSGHTAYAVVAQWHEDIVMRGRESYD